MWTKGAKLQEMSKSGQTKKNVGPNKQRNRGFEAHETP